MKTSYLSLTSVLTTVCVPTLLGEEFSARIVDGRGRPLSGVAVEIILYGPRAAGDKHGSQVSLLKLRSNENGMVRGNYDKKAITGDAFTSVDLSKEGYQENTHWFGKFQKEYVLKRVFREPDIARIAKLPDKARTQELKELMVGDLAGEILERALFKMDHAFRPALRDLVQDPEFGMSLISWRSSACLKTSS